MKELIKRSLLLVLLSYVLAVCANAQVTGNHSSNKAVLDWLENHFNKKFNGDHVCIKRLKNSKRVTIIGFPDFDLKCRFNGVFVDSIYFETTDRTLSKNPLVALGWEKASRQEREDLAKNFVEKCFFAFYVGQNQSFAAISTDDGGLKVIVSLEYPLGVTSRNAPKIFVFDKDGSMLLPNNI